MKVEILEEKLKAKDRETGRHYDLEEGDRVTVSDLCGQHWCDQGWSKDLSGDYPTAERRVVNATVQPHSARHDTTDSNGEEG